MTRALTFAACLTLPLALIATQAIGQSRTDMSGADPSQCDIFKALGKTLPVSCGGTPVATPTPVKTRGLSIDFDDKTPPAPNQPPIDQTTVAPEPPPAPPPVKEAVFTLQFELDSARLTDQARLLLDKIAVVMADPSSAGANFLIRGFTDSSGAPLHNLELSGARAESARLYLIEAHGVPPDMISSQGLGATKPLPGLPPTSPSNRRVEIVADYRR